MSDHYQRRAALTDILLALGDDFSPDGLAPLDQFHSGGIQATRDLAALAKVGPGEALLDVGSGAGGPARLLARERKAKVSAIDLTPGYVALAKALSEKSGTAVEF